MLKFYLKLFVLTIVLSCPAGSYSYAAQAATASTDTTTVDWTGIEQHRVLLLYPGVTSWEFLQSKNHKLGAHAIKRNRKSCRHCHLSNEGELDMDVAHIVTGSLKKKYSHEYFEPEPIKGKKPTLKAKLQAAYDNEYLYIRVEWESKGIGWRTPGDNNRPDRISLQLNGTNSAFKRYGCFIACHSDVSTMPESPSKENVLTNRYYKAIGRDHVRLYAYYTKDAWNRPKPAPELAKLRKNGGVIDLWSLEFSSNSTKSRDGFIFSDRLWQKKKSIEATGVWAESGYSAVFKRRLGAGGAKDIAIVKNGVISVGIAIHDNVTVGRKHYVSFPLSIGLGVKADIEAVKIDR